MTKLLMPLLLATSTIASAQISFAAKGHLLFPTSSASWKNIKNIGQKAYEEKGKNNIGFNIGISSKISLPISFFVMPELYFTSFKNEIKEPTSNTTIQAKSNRVDLPILVGYNLWGETLGVFAGPVASYNISTKNTFKDFQENATKDFTVGFQFGLQAKVSKLIIDARYESAFSKDQREFINKLNNYTIKYDNRPSVFMLGLGYKF